MKDDIIFLTIDYQYDFLQPPKDYSFQPHCSLNSNPIQPEYIPPPITFTFDPKRYAKLFRSFTNFAFPIDI